MCYICPSTQPKEANINTPQQELSPEQVGKGYQRVVNIIYHNLMFGDVILAELAKQKQRLRNPSEINFSTMSPAELREFGAINNSLMYLLVIAPNNLPTKTVEQAGQGEIAEGLITYVTQVIEVLKNSKLLIPISQAAPIKQKLH